MARMKRMDTGKDFFKETVQSVQSTFKIIARLSTTNFE